MQVITTLDVADEFLVSGVLDEADKPIGVRRFHEREEWQPTATSRLRFSRTLDALTQARAWVQESPRRMALVYIRERGQVIAQYYLAASGTFGSIVYGSAGNVLGAQSRELFCDSLPVLRPDQFGQFGALFTQWYIVREAEWTSPLTSQLRDYLGDAQEDLSLLLRRVDKDILQSTDPELLQASAHVLGASAALTFLQEKYPFEIDVAAVANMGYPPSLAVDILFDYYTRLLKRKDRSDDVKLLQRLWWRPFQQMGA